MADSNPTIKLSLVDDISKKLNNISGSVNNTTKNVGNFAKSAVVGFAKVGTAITGLGLATGGLLLKAGSDTQNLKTSLTTAFGGVREDAEKAFDTINKFATATPYSLNQVLTSFIKLKNMGLDPSERALTAYGDTASSMGKSLDQMVEAVADATTGEFERLKEFGIRSSKEGDRVKFTFRGMTQDVKFSSEEIQEYLMGIGETYFVGGMADQSKNLSGQLNTLKDNVTIAFSTIATESGLLDTATDAIAKLNDYLSEIDWKKVGELITKYLITSIDKTVDALRKVNYFYQKHKTIIDTVLIVLGSLAAAFGIVIGVIKIATAVMATFTAVMAIITSPVTWVIAVIGLLIAGIILLWRNWDWISAKLIEAWNWVGNTVKSISDSIRNKISQVWNSIMNTINRAIASVTWAIQNWQYILGFLIGYLAGNFLQGLQWVWTQVVNGFNWIVDRVRELPGKFIEGAKGLWNFVTNGISLAHNGLVNGINWIIDRIRELPQRARDGARALWEFVSNGIGNAHNSISSGINWIIDRFKEIPDKVKEAVGSMWSTGRDAMSSFWKGLTSGLGKTAQGIKDGLKAAGISGFATGVRNFGGGLAMVGENGPELVNLPKGSSVMTNNQSQKMGTGQVTININNPTVREDNDITLIVEAVKRALSQDLKTKMMGL